MKLGSETLISPLTKMLSFTGSPETLLVLTTSV